jgi:retron-type reverse transcriptase
MKRVGNLWNKFISKENFRLAWYKTALGRRDRKDVQEFEKNLEENLEKIRQEVIAGKFTTSKYSTKQIFENGKHRLIYILPLKDRIVHHAINNIIEEIFVKGFIQHSYGCIKDRGPLAGSYRLRKLIMKNDYCLKTDIKKFYPTVDQQILYDEVCKKIKDVKLLKIIKDIIFSFPGGKNCPIGNLTSQLFGNIYLNKLDKLLKHKIKVKDYCRYCDDCVILSNSKEQLFVIQKLIHEFIDVELKQSMSYSEVFHTKQGIDFLGYRHFRGYTILRKRTAKKFKRAVLDIIKNRDKRPFLQQLCTLNSYRGYAKHCYTYNLIRSLDLDNLIKDMSIKEFKNVGPKPEFPMTGTKISILTLIDKPIIVTSWKPCKINNENSNKLQFIFADNEKDTQLHITFTRSKVVEKTVTTNKLRRFSI